jgi:hypothetical protein
VKTSRHQKVAQRKRRIERRLRPRTWCAQARPMYRASNIRYEHSDRVRGLAHGGIGAMHRLAQHVGLVDAIDDHVHVLKVHLLRARAHNRWNAERIVTRSPVLRGSAMWSSRCVRTPHNGARCERRDELVAGPEPSGA